MRHVTIAAPVKDAESLELKEGFSINDHWVDFCGRHAHIAGDIEFWIVPLVEAKESWDKNYEWIDHVQTAAVPTTKEMKVFGWLYKATKLEAMKEDCWLSDTYVIADKVSIVRGAYKDALVIRHEDIDGIHAHEPILEMLQRNQPEVGWVAVPLYLG
jgi:hypothetical protein